MTLSGFSLKNHSHFSQYWNDNIGVHSLVYQSRGSLICNVTPGDKIGRNGTPSEIPIFSEVYALKSPVF